MRCSDTFAVTGRNLILQFTVPRLNLPLPEIL